jgi:diguanylate cyclase (GGDEF)-like protein
MDDFDRDRDFGRTVTAGESSYLSEQAAVGEFTLSAWNPNGNGTGSGSGPRNIRLALASTLGGILFAALCYVIVISTWRPVEAWEPIIALGALALVAGYFPVHVSYANVSLGVSFLLASTLLAGPAIGGLTAVAVTLVWSFTRRLFPWFSYVRKTGGVHQITRAFFISMNSGLAFSASGLLAFSAYDLEPPVARVSVASLGACITLTIGVYLIHNIANMLVSVAAGDDVGKYLRLRIPIPALLEFIALPAALLLAVTYVKLGVGAFSLMAWLYLVGSFLGWRSWQDRESLKDRLDEMEVLHRAGATLSGALEMGELVRRLHATLIQVISASQMTLLLRDASGEEPPQVYSFDEVGNRGSVDPDRIVETEGRPEGLFSEPDGTFVYVLDLGSGNSGDVRLRLDLEAGNRPSGQKLRMLETLCRQAGTDFSNARLYRQANTDPLTGVSQRRYFERALRQVAVGEGRFAVIMLDLDWFKKVNDAYGHRVGDGVLRDLAQILKGSLRVMDVCARYGGEEFVILLPGASSPEAASGAERIRRILDQRKIELDGLQIRYTASFGVADQNDLGQTADPMGVVWRADTALLEAKRAGRNQVVTYASLTKQSRPLKERNPAP